MSVDFKDKDLSENERFLTYVEDIYDGVKTIKNSKAYLKQYERESDNAYLKRLDRSTFTNIFRKSIDNLSSLLLRKTPEVDYKVRNEYLVKNIDGKGSSIHNILKEVSVKALRDGLTYLWVDSNKVEGNVNLSQAEGITPFIKSIDRKDVISKRVGYKNGKAFIKQMVIKQVIELEIDDFKVEDKEVYIVLRPGMGAIYKNGDKKGEFDVVSSWNNNLDYVPVVPVYSAKTGYLQADIPLLDLADMNIAHYNATSNLEGILRMAALPVAVTFGNEFEKNQNKKEGLTLSAQTALAFNDRTTEGFEWKEINGTSIVRLESNIEHIKKDMIGIASSILSDKNYMTATEVKVSEGSNNLFLLELAYSLETGLNRCVEIMSDYIGRDIDITVNLNKDFNTIALDPNLVDKITQFKRDGLISLDTFFKTMVNGEILDIKDFEAEKAMIEEERESFDFEGEVVNE